MVGGQRPGGLRADPVESGEVWPHTHAAAVIGSPAEALAAAVPFLDAGLSAGDVVVLSCPPERNESLRRELVGRAAGVRTDTRLSLFDTRAPDAVAALRGLVQQAARSASGRVRVVGETRFGPRPRNWREGQRYESVMNALFSAEPIDALCLYDRSNLPAAVADSAAATHPALLVDGIARANPRYQSPPDYLVGLPLPREALEEGDPFFAVDDAAALAPLRHQLAAALAAVVPDREQREDLHLAVSEVAANAFRHGKPPIAARAWASADRVVCTVRDRGTGFGDPLAGFQPAHGADLSRGGMGLWLARKLWDHVDLLPGPEGLTVRLSSALR